MIYFLAGLILPFLSFKTYKCLGYLKGRKKKPQTFHNVDTIWVLGIFGSLFGSWKGIRQYGLLEFQSLGLHIASDLSSPTPSYIFISLKDLLYGT